MNVNRFKYVILLLAFFGVSACASKSELFDEGPRTGKPCPERRVLMVRNNTGVEMEIVESRRGSGARIVIAYARTGVQEIPIRNDYQYAYSARLVEGKDVISTTNRRRVRDRTVELTRECREGESQE